MRSFAQIARRNSTTLTALVDNGLVYGTGIVVTGADISDDPRLVRAKLEGRLVAGTQNHVLDPLVASHQRARDPNQLPTAVGSSDSMSMTQEAAVRRRSGWRRAEATTKQVEEAGSDPASRARIQLLLAAGVSASPTSAKCG